METETRKTKNDPKPKDCQWHHLVPEQILKGKLTRLPEDKQKGYLKARAFLLEHGVDAKRLDKVGLYLPKSVAAKQALNTTRCIHNGFTTEHQEYNDMAFTVHLNYA